MSRGYKGGVRSEETPRLKMVGWYDPGQLLNTGVQVLIQQVMGPRADFRLMESFGGPQEVFDEFASRDELWFDYVADIGDGWDSTYTIASLLARTHLQVGDRDLPRGEFLVMGGDEVYPLASRDNYHDRLLGPYSCALPKTDEPHPALFAVPGNHDWYDGLIAFTRLFCQPRWIGGWRTRQKRSYFAIKLPHNWWLWAVDYQLASDIDDAQRDYFCDIADKQMKPGDRVILATAEPDWIYGNIYDAKFKSNIAYLQEKVIRERAGAAMRVAISGDLHHYRRHEETCDHATHLITSGGGGAFTVTTYGPDASEIKLGKEQVRTYALKSEYPDQKTSKRLLLQNLLFPFINPKFGVLTALLYLIVAWIYRIPVLRETEIILRNGDAVGGVHALTRALLNSPSGFGALLVVIVGFVAFTDTHKKLYKYIGGTAHALANLAALFFVTVGASQVSREIFGFAAGSVSYLLSSAALILIGGYFAGSFIMGAYLYFSLRLFRRHNREAFSALRNADYKHFVRFHIGRDGALTVYPVAVDKTPRRWKPATAEHGPRWEPADVPITPHLIEEPVRIV